MLDPSLIAVGLIRYLKSGSDTVHSDPIPLAISSSYSVRALQIVSYLRLATVFCSVCFCNQFALPDVGDRWSLTAAPSLQLDLSCYRFVYCSKGDIHSRHPQQFSAFSIAVVSNSSATSVSSVGKFHLACVRAYSRSVFMLRPLSVSLSRTCACLDGFLHCQLGPGQLHAET